MCIFCVGMVNKIYLDVLQRRAIGTTSQIAQNVTEKMSDHLCYLRDSSIYVHGTVATPPPDLCGRFQHVSCRAMPSAKLAKTAYE